MKQYWKYFWYVIEHKKNVFIEFFKTKQFIHALTHDMSKFLPSEFIPYAKFFYETDRYNKYTYSIDNINFQQGWGFHQKRNKHHWNYWIYVTSEKEIIKMPMPIKYIHQMMADWKGMSRKFGDNPVSYYIKNKHSLILHDDTIKNIEKILNIKT